MNQIEDRFRELFAIVPPPATPPPPIDEIRRRAGRQRLHSALAAATAVAVLAGATVIGVGLARTTAEQHFATGVTAISAHLDGVPARFHQWLVASQTVDGTTVQAASYRAHGRACIVHTGGGWCQANGTLVGQVADYGSGSSGTIASIVGSVPAAARTVVVHLGDSVLRTPAVLTPTSNDVRFFAVFMPTPLPGATPAQPVLGVLDGNGHPVAPWISEGPVHVASQRTRAAGLPAAQWGFSFSSTGWTAIAYRHLGATCVYATGVSTIGNAGHAPWCAAAAPMHARVLGVINLGRHTTLLIGDAPAWSRSVMLWGRDGFTKSSTVRSPAAQDRHFWAAVTTAPNQAQHIATCADGDNCIDVRSYP